MKTAKYFTLGVLIVAAVLTASAEDHPSAMSTGFDYYQRCHDAMDTATTVEQSAINLTCTAYTAGVLDGMALLEAMMGKEVLSKYQRRDCRRTVQHDAD